MPAGLKGTRRHRRRDRVSRIRDLFLVVVTPHAWVCPSPKVRGSVRRLRENARGAYEGKHSRALRMTRAQMSDVE